MNIELIERLWLQTKVVDGCWIWTGKKLLNRGKRDYGYISIRRKNKLIHRLSICIYLGLSYNDNSWESCHICGNKACWNPLHLYAGDRKTNANDIYKDMTHCKYGHERNEVNTYVNSSGTKGCKICMVAYQKIYRMEHRKGH